MLHASFLRCLYTILVKKLVLTFNEKSAIDAMIY